MFYICRITSIFSVHISLEHVLKVGERERDLERVLHISSHTRLIQVLPGQSLAECGHISTIHNLGMSYRCRSLDMYQAPEPRPAGRGRWCCYPRRAPGPPPPCGRAGPPLAPWRRCRTSASSARRTGSGWCRAWSAKCSAFRCILQDAPSGSASATCDATRDCLVVFDDVQPLSGFLVDVVVRVQPGDDEHELALEAMLCKLDFHRFLDTNPAVVDDIYVK